MPFYLEISKNITKQRDIYDTVIYYTDENFPQRSFPH